MSYSLVAELGNGLSTRIRGGPVVFLVEEAVRLEWNSACSPPIARLPGRSPLQDADAVGCALGGGDCVCMCDLSGPLGAEADAHGVIAS